MFTRSALLLTSAAMMAFAIPAAAQDGRYGDVVDQADVAWEQQEVVQPIHEVEDAADMATMHRGRHSRRGGGHDHGLGHGQGEMRHDARPRLAYSEQEREAWLADCQIAMRSEEYYYDDARYDDGGDDNGGLIGGLLGAVVGGVAGNRIGGSGDRLAGTLLGAGIGGIAGAVLGSVISGDEDESDYTSSYDRDAEEAWAADYCGAYLRRYEASGQAGYGQMAYAQVQPVMMMTAPARHGGMREVVREEWVDAPAEHEERRTRRRTIQRRAAPEQGKLTSVD